MIIREKNRVRSLEKHISGQDVPIPNKVEDRSSDQSFSFNQDLIDDEINIMATVEELKALFLKKVLIIWHDADMGIIIKYSPQLEKICELRIFQNWKEASDFIIENSVHCFVITSETNGEQLVQTIYDKPHVLNINVFCENVIFTNKWTTNYKTIIPVEADYQTMISRVSEQVLQWQKNESSLRRDLPLFSPIFDDYDKSENNNLNLYLTELTKFINRNQSKVDFLRLAAEIYSDKKNMIEFDKTYHDYDMMHILRWYTKESFLYKLTNNCLRIATPDSIFYCRLILKDLERAIKERYHVSSKNFGGLVYRAAYMSEKDWSSLEQNQGKDIEMHGFLSTTPMMEVAKEFFYGDIDKKTFITIIVPAISNQQSQGFVELTEFSEFPLEKEILFNIRSRFTILETIVQQIDGLTTRHLFLLYGGREIRKYLTLSNPVIEIKVNTWKQPKCSLCDKVIEISQNSMFFINLTDTSEYRCFQCAKKYKNIGAPALACVHSLSALSSINLKIKGIVAKYSSDLKIPFYGSKCSLCQKKTLEQKFACQVCVNPMKQWCEACFDENNSCFHAKHLIVLENRPFTFWSEKMTEVEFLQMQASQKDQLSDPGEVFQNTNDFIRARDYYEKCLRKNQANGLNALVLYSNLGSVYFDLGELDKSLGFHSKALEIALINYGDDHPISANSYDNIGVVYYNLNQLEKAKECHLKALEINLKCTERKNSDTANSYNNLGIVYEQLSNFEEALECHTAALQIRKKAHGKKHPSTLGSYNNLGSVYFHLGLFEKAMELQTIALESYISIYGNNHPETARSYNNLGNTLYQLGQFDKAMDYQKKALSIRKFVYGNNHPETGHSFNNLGSLYYELDELEKAMDCYENTLRIYELAYGKEHTSTANAYTNLGNVHDQLENLKIATEYYINALRIRKKVLGKKHPQTADSYNCLGSIHFQLGNYEKAQTYHLRALEIYQAVYGKNHFQLANCYFKLGNIFDELAQFKEACEYYSLALEIRLKVYGKNHSETAEAYSSLGSVYGKLGEFERALESYLHSLEIRKASYGNNHSETADVYYHLGLIYVHLRHFEIAQKCFLASFQIRKTLFDPQHPDVIDSFNQLKALKGKFVEANNAIEKKNKESLADKSVQKSIVKIESKFNEQPIKIQEANYKMSTRELTKMRERGLNLIEDESYDEAIDIFCQLVQVNPKDHEAYYYWGVALLEKKKYTEACQKFEKSHNLEPMSRSQRNEWQKAKEKALLEKT